MDTKKALKKHARSHHSLEDAMHKVHKEAGKPKRQASTKPRYFSLVHDVKK